MLFRIHRGVKRIARRISERLNPGPIILYYHRIADEIYDPQLLCVSPDKFERHMALLSELVRPRALTDLVSDLDSKRLSPCDVVVTFDDGYVDNFRVAAKILNRYSIPATFFVSTGLLGTRRQFYWDELSRLILESRWLPRIIEISIAGQVQKFIFEDKDEPSTPDWTVLHPAVRDRQKAYLKICSLLVGLTPMERELVVADIVSQIGFNRDGPEASRVMNHDELRTIDAMSGLEIGAHTVSHPCLAKLSEADQHVEIIESKNTLEAILGHRVSHFTYPFGGTRDVSPLSHRLIREIGFNAACSTFDGVVRNNSDRLQLPRILVRNWDQETFISRILMRTGRQ